MKNDTLCGTAYGAITASFIISRVELLTLSLLATVLSQALMPIGLFGYICAISATIPTIPPECDTKRAKYTFIVSYGNKVILHNYFT